MMKTNQIIGRNLASLRKARGLTQGQIAEKFNYSDKSISKWEHGEMVPDVETLLSLADFYGVTLDYLVHDQTAESLEEVGKNDYQAIKRNRIITTCLAVVMVWTVACIAYVGGLLLNSAWDSWMAFFWAFPVTSLVLRYFLRKYFPKDTPNWLKLTINLLFIWSSLLAIYLELGLGIQDDQGWILWFVLFAGIPITLILLYAYFSKRSKPIEKEEAPTTSVSSKDEPKQN